MKFKGTKPKDVDVGSKAILETSEVKIKSTNQSKVEPKSPIMTKTKKTKQTLKINPEYKENE